MPGIVIHKRSAKNCEEADPGRYGALVAFARSWARTLRRAPVVGLVGVMVAFISIGSLFALQQPPFVGPDEKAHLGYAHEIASGRLPTIETHADIPPSASTWSSEMNFTMVEANRTVWVANHAPLFYVSVAPFIWTAEVLDRSDGGLLYLRLANVAYGAIGIAFTYLLAKELTSSDRLALLSAAATAAVTQLYASLSQGMSDGLAFAAGAAVTWAALRCLQRGTTSRNLAILAAATAVATGARGVTMLLALAAVVVVAYFEYRRAGERYAAARFRSAARVVLIGVVPALILFGWFYVRNIVLYGDIGASTYLLDRFNRQPRGSVLAMLLDTELWRSLWFRSMSPATFGGSHPPWMLTVAALGVVGLGVVAVTRRVGDRDVGGARAVVARSSLLVLTSGIAVVVWYIAEHLSGGGSLHPRYLFPVIGSVVTLLVIGLDRLLPRILAVILLFLMGLWTLSHLPVDVDVGRLSRPRDRGQLPPLPLRTLPGSDNWRVAAGVGIVLGCVGAVMALVVVMSADGRRSMQRAEAETT